MNLDVAGRTVDMISFDFRVTLLFGDQSTIVVETPFDIEFKDDTRVRVDPDRIENPAAVLSALHDEVVAAHYDESGTLRLEMIRSTWIVAQDPNYESWSFGSKKSPSRIVSGPSGSFSVWD